MQLLDVLPTTNILALADAAPMLTATTTTPSRIR